MVQKAATVIYLLVAMTSRLINSSLCSKSETKNKPNDSLCVFSASNGGASEQWVVFGDGKGRELLRVVVARITAVKIEQAKLT